MTSKPQSSGHAELADELECAVNRAGLEWFYGPLLMKAAKALRLSANRQETSPVAWRCFHCDETLTDAEAAKDHFGYDMLAEPGCKLNAIEGGLLGIVRRQEEKLEAYHREDTASYREFYALGGDHSRALRDEEQKGYDRGLKDGQASPKNLIEELGEDNEGLDQGATDVASPSSGHLPAWLPIETAPRDGTWFLIYLADEDDGPFSAYEVGKYDPYMTTDYIEVEGGLYRKELRSSYDWAGFNNFHRATHWMPLPEPPEPG